MKYPALLAISAMLITGAGCGEDGGSSSTEKAFAVRADTTMSVARNLSKTGFVTRVNKLCREAWPYIHDNFAEYRTAQASSGSRRERLADAIRVSLMASIDFHIFDNIYMLGAPMGETSEAEELVGALQEAVERGQRLDPLYSATEVTALFGDFNRRAGHYGLHECLVNEPHMPI